MNVIIFQKFIFDIMTENNYNVNKLFGIQTQKMRDTHAKKLYTPKNTSALSFDIYINLKYNTFQYFQSSRLL